ncbi:MAG TPA: hypothetical protein VFB06_01525 [Streptosporangiaceae bacterium]|nr:hypothetical protein [Streptosporangiaceae bacterium]
MNQTEDLVRSTTRALAETVRAVPPPPPIPEAAWRDQVTSGHRTRSAWAAPLAAAAAVVVVAVGAVTASSVLTKSGTPRPSASGATANGVSAGSYTRVPPYYVAVVNSSLTVVRATWTGATLARITTKTPVAGVAGAADGRTFVLDEQRSIMGGSVTWVGQPAFYLLRLTASGTEQSLTRLAVPAIPNGTVVSGLAMSPDGSKLAVDVNSGGWPQARLMEIMSYTLATGAFRSWTTSGLTNAEAPFGFTGSGVDGAQSISWAADSRTLVFSVENKSYTGVRLLDTAAGGSDLIADSRLAVIERVLGDRGPRKPAPPDYFLSCATDAMISIDGSAIVCGYSTSVGNTTTMGFAHYSIASGKMNRVTGLVHFRGEAPTGISLYWVNSTGNTVIGTSETRGGGRVGVMNGSTFTPLPGVTGFAAIAW